MAFLFGGGVAAFPVLLALRWCLQLLQLNFYLFLQTGADGLCGRCSVTTLSSELSYANISCFKALKLPIIVRLKVLLLEYFIFLVSTDATEIHRQSEASEDILLCVSYSTSEKQ